MQNFHGSQICKSSLHHNGSWNPWVRRGSGRRTFRSHDLGQCRRYPV